MFFTRLENCNCAVLARDVRLFIFAIAPDGLCGSYPSKPNRTITAGLPTIRLLAGIQHYVGLSRRGPANPV
jgi:hypothetical protein